jgi:hypothetical protein
MNDLVPRRLFTLHEVVGYMVAIGVPMVAVRVSVVGRRKARWCY